MTKDPFTVLAELAEQYLEVGKATLQRGDDVLPVLVTIDATGHVGVHAMVSLPEGVDKGEVLRLIASSTKAMALLFFSDAYTLDPETHERNGEVLTAHVESRDGRTTGVACRYTREPLTFGEPERSYGSEWISGPLFPSKQRVH